MEERVEMERDNPKSLANTRKFVISEGWCSVEETLTSCPFFNLIASSCAVT
jgi:hypothetical protein